ncbi:YqjF family protein [Tenacibaculum amylolyticum]|uniref:YqjF family protein n=1 Tax=Tenacibaculum amylolyticum TaxID=104269 RepID=UPI003894EC87
MSFLTAEWRKLIMVNYTIDPKVLAPYVPQGTILDSFEGKCYVSLIGFMFVNTKLLGIKVPFHVNFEEVNLRFYVKRLEDGKEKRGVVFIKEIVPKAAITFVANTFYKEKYETLKMKHEWQKVQDDLAIAYQWKKNGIWNHIKVIAENQQIAMEQHSEVEFIAEHYWGFSKNSETKTTMYEVQHPKWNYYPVKESTINVDFNATYGNNFAFLNKQKPTSVFLLEGSEISVENKTII